MGGPVKKGVGHEAQGISLVRTGSGLRRIKDRFEKLAGKGPVPAPVQQGAVFQPNGPRQLRMVENIGPLAAQAENSPVRAANPLPDRGQSFSAIPPSHAAVQFSDKVFSK
jgi:hypothetical protein